MLSCQSSIQYWTFALVVVLLQFCGRGKSFAAPTDPAAASNVSHTETTQIKSDDRFYAEAWSTLVEDASAVATILAIGAGGAWAYFNFIKGRVYRSRLELNASAAFNSSPESDYLLVTSKLKNVGLSKVAIVHEGTTTRLSANESPDASDIHEVDWEHLATFGVFADHDWIEPGELIQDQRLFVLPNGNRSAFRIETRVCSTRSEWNATSIASHGDRVKDLADD